jgi:aspartokinase/homoserine dehydrogenase 1
MLHIIKFGGTSVANADRIRRAVSIVAERKRKHDVAVVVSAFSGVTNELISLSEMAASGDKAFVSHFSQLRERHLETAQELSPGNTALMEHLNHLLDLLSTDCESLAQQGKVGQRERDRIMSYGERMSVAVFAAAMDVAGIPAQSFESTAFVRTNDRFGDADVDQTTTSELAKKIILPLHGKVPVITGFIGATDDGRITTLGRSGSDYTAGIMGEALSADVVEIWTDVDGVLTADPNIASNAVTIPQLNYSEMAEMAQFGTSVVHPRTVLPLKELKIPILIKNTLNPGAEGTLITDSDEETMNTLRSVSLKKSVVLLGLRSKGLDKIRGFLGRALDALNSANIPVLYTASASAEFGFSVVFEPEYLDQATQVLHNEFEREYAAGFLNEPLVRTGISMVTVIGDRLTNDVGLSGAVLTVLGANNLAPISLAKGAANRHLSLIMEKQDALMAVQLLNDHFCIHARQVRLFVAGVGTVGAELLRQIKALKKTTVHLSLIGVCNRTKTYWNAQGIDADEVDDLLSRGQLTHWEDTVDRLIREFPYRTIFVDCTGSQDVARLYATLLKAGIHIATPSKLANTMEQSYFDELNGYHEETQVCYHYETTVGAGLPVIHTIRDLMQAGDTVHRISGVVSGTMTYLFDALEQGTSFSEAIKNAKVLGYSEPDPRDDLSGEDVARKFMTLARTAGYRVERKELQVESMIPDELKEVGLEEFMERIADYDDFWRHRIDEAKAEDKVLRYVGILDEGKIRVRVEAVPMKSPLGSLSGTDNQIAITTDRYDIHPLIIQGPGAGREVTAAGLLADIQKVCDMIF